MLSPVTVQGALLQALIRGESYGLELIERVEKHSKGQIKLHQGSVYPALRTMEDDGLVRSYDGESIPERGGRPRRYYVLTPKGKEVAESHREIAQDLFGLELAYVK